MSIHHQISTDLDPDLIARARGGDDSALADLWTRHAGFARSCALRISSTLDPDDLVSEAFARIVERLLAGGGPTGDFRPYLYVTVRNLAAEWGRARREFTVEDETWFDSIQATGPAPESDGERELLLRAFASLPERWRQVLWLTTVEERSHAQVAAAIGIKPNAVAQLTFRARESLRTAWIQQHIPLTAKNTDCRWAVERMGAYERKKLGRRDRTQFEAHVNHCFTCSRLVELAAEVGSRIRMVLLPMLLAGGYGAWEASVAPTRAVASTTVRTDARGRWARIAGITLLTAGALVGVAADTPTVPAALTEPASPVPAGSTRPLAQHLPRTVAVTPGPVETPGAPIPANEAQSAPATPTDASAEGSTSFAASPTGATAADTPPAAAPPMQSVASGSYSIAFASGIRSTGESGYFAVDLVVTNTYESPTAATAGFLVRTPVSGESFTVASVQAASGMDDLDASISAGRAGTTVMVHGTLDAGGSRIVTVLLHSDPESWPVRDSGWGTLCETLVPSLEVTVALLGESGVVDDASAVSTSLSGIGVCEL